MQTKTNTVSLATLNDGAVIEAVDIALQRVFDNIVDPNTDAKTVREVTLKIKIKPSDDRDFGQISYQAVPKLAPDIEQITQVEIGRALSGAAEARERQKRQAPESAPENVTDFKTKAAGR
ncbi:MAG: hypothetical protein RBT11_01770 [Desulfobacterales bacterium]|nr:hypothetical protein [Desulfobacterales bacterium]